MEDHRPLCYRARFTEKRTLACAGGWSAPLSSSTHWGVPLWVAGAAMLGLIPYGPVIRAAATLPFWAGWLAVDRSGGT